MARFRAENLILQGDQKVRFGVDYNNISKSELWWDPSAPHPTTSGDLRLSTTVSGIDPIYDYHLTTKQYVDDAIISVSGSLLNTVSDNYIDNSEMATISGDLQSQIDNKDNYQYWTFAVDGTSQDNITSTATLNFASAGGVTITRTAANEITISGVSESAIITDHGELTGLLDDDHPQYILVDGSRGFTGTVSGVDPVQPFHLATKKYVDNSVYGLDWKDSVIDIVPVSSGVQTTGNRYIASETGGGWVKDQIYEWDGSQWINDPVNEGAAAWVENRDGVYTFNGTEWVKFGNTVTHNNLSGLQGGNGSDEYYHLTLSMYTDLTNFGGITNASSQHIHDDRYYTESELDAGQLDNRYYTENEVDTISGVLQAEIDNKADINHSHTSNDITDFIEAAQDAVANSMIGAGTVSVVYDDANDQITISGSGIIDHGGLTGLLDDDHPQYILVDGSRGFTNTVSGVYPIQNYDLATKQYVDDTVSSGIDRHGKVSIPYQAQQVTVNFPDLGHTNYAVNVTLENTTDSPPSIYAFIVSSKNSNSFVVDFSGRMDSANYVLNWMIVED